MVAPWAAQSPTTRASSTPSKNSAQLYVVRLMNAPPAIRACHIMASSHRPPRPLAAYMWPANGQTTENRAELSPPSHSPFPTRFKPRQAPVTQRGFLTHPPQPRGPAQFNPGGPGSAICYYLELPRSSEPRGGLHCSPRAPARAPPPPGVSAEVYS
jgi:hypothetical protein